MVENEKMIAAGNAWSRADGAITVACAELAAVPGTAAQYLRLCQLAEAFQQAARAEIDAAWRVAGR